MTERDWLAATDPERLLKWLKGQVSDRKLRLLAVAACHRVRHLLTDARSLEAIDQAERFAEGDLAAEDLATAHAAAGEACEALRHAINNAGGDGIALDMLESMGVHTAACMVAARDSTNGAIVTVRATTGLLFGFSAHAKPRLRELSALVRDICGNPFRPVTLDPAWRTGTVLALAASIYGERGFDTLPILADALEEAGCTSADLLNHCRQPGEHVRGCWAVDMILGKK